ncbi:acyl carrier protein [Embleya sp. AB8]|uniref:acyl carrier protein n=1 Tax=Embleya sp. AB8 TaxID=3156304 RepID=UPI003C726C12
MLCELLVEEFGIDAADIVPEATFESVGMDSLSMAELVIIVADRTGKDFGALGTLGQNATLLEAAAVFEADVPAEPLVPAIPDPTASSDTPEPAAAAVASVPAPAPVLASSSDN